MSSQPTHLRLLHRHTQPPATCSIPTAIWKVTLPKAAKAPGEQSPVAMWLGLDPAQASVVQEAGGPQQDLLEETSFRYFDALKCPVPELTYASIFLKAK